MRNAIRQGLSHLTFRTPELLASVYNDRFGNQLPYEFNNWQNNDKDKFSFGLNNYLYFYVNMFKLTGDTVWIDHAVSCCDHMFDNTDAERVSKGEFSVEPFTGHVYVNSIRFYPSQSYYQAASNNYVSGMPQNGWSSFNATTGGVLLGGIRYTGVEYNNEIGITSLVQAGGVATATTAVAHGLTTGDAVIITGANEAGYNDDVQITVVSTTQFTFATSETTDATGVISCYKLIRNRRNQVLTDGQIIAAISAVVDVILDNQGVLGSYVSIANDYLDKIKLNITERDLNYVRNRADADPDISPDGIWYYTNRFNTSIGLLDDQILAFNHCAGISQACLIYYKHRIVSDTVIAQEFYDKANDFMEFTRTPRAREVLSDARYWWAYKVLNNNEVSEDLNHGSYTFAFFEVAYKNGYLNFTNNELTRYANSAVHAWRNSNQVGDVAERFDGTGSVSEIPDGEIYSIGTFTWLSEFNPDIFRMSRDLMGAREVSYFDNYGYFYSAASNMLLNIPDSTIY